MVDREIIDRFLNRLIESVILNKEKDTLTINFQDGSYIELTVEGDCCSSSWIEHCEVPVNIDGAIFTGYYESDDVTTEDQDSAYACLQIYQAYIYTNRGMITMEYRNSSNGYYGGYTVLNKYFDVRGEISA